MGLSFRVITWAREALGKAHELMDRARELMTGPMSSRVAGVKLMGGSQCLGDAIMALTIASMSSLDASLSFWVPRVSFRPALIALMSSKGVASGRTVKLRNEVEGSRSLP
jgi:hypothetical protein